MTEQGYPRSGFVRKWLERGSAETKPENLAESLKTICKDNLKSVILYGSHAAGDHVAKRSDYNILVVLNQLGAQELTALANLSSQWVKEGNPTPLFLTSKRLRRSADVFPIELTDIKENHKVLFGQDPMEDIAIDLSNLRFELEHEMRGKLIQLHTRFLMTRAKPKEVRELLINSLSTFLVLFRASLRLHREPVPARKADILPMLKRHVDFDDEIFRIIGEMKGGQKHAGLDPLELFARYLKSIEKIVDIVDEWTKQEKNK